MERAWEGMGKGTYAQRKKKQTEKKKHAKFNTQKSEHLGMKEQKIIRTHMAGENYYILCC